MKCTTVRVDTFENIQINAGIILSEFDPDNGSFEKEKIIGTTSGGITFDSGAEFSDFGEDIDNVPNNTWQLKRLTRYAPSISGTFVTMDTTLGHKLTATGVIASDNENHIVPSDTLDEANFGSIWFVGDYSQKNSDESGGYIAIHVKNALSTGGFKWKSTKDGKGTFDFEFTGHYDINDVSEQPFEIYIVHGEDEASE